MSRAFDRLAYFIIVQIAVAPIVVREIASVPSSEGGTPQTALLHHRKLLPGFSVPSCSCS